MPEDSRDPRFRELDRLMALGQGDVHRQDPPASLQTLHCVTCGRWFYRRLRDIDPDQPQYCRALCRSIGTMRRRGHWHKPAFEPPEERREVYLREKGVAA